jgi:hypothetical protein
MQEVLGLPEQVIVECIIGIGHSYEQKSLLSMYTLQHH